MSELKLQQSRLDGRYDILECLGRGSYAEIYVANDNAAAEGAPRTIVIKALNLYLQDAPDAELERTLVSNFQNEAVALDRVRHPNVINRLGHGTAIDLAGTTFHYIVLEYLARRRSVCADENATAVDPKSALLSRAGLFRTCTRAQVRRDPSRHQAAKPFADCRSRRS